MMLKIGETFQEYVIDSQLEIGDCEYREVYLAHTTEDGNSVFLTIYSIEDMPKYMDAENIHEFEMCSLLRGEQFLDFITRGMDTVKGKPIAWMATKAVPYRTLTDLMATEFPDEEDVLNMFCTILEGMKQISRLLPKGGHFNLNPNTIIVSDKDDMQRRHVYIVDLCHVSTSSSGKADFDTSNINPLYRSKETLLGRFSTSSTIYSLGLLLGYMLCGYFPYTIEEGDTPKTITKRVEVEKLPTVIPDALKRIIYKAISSNTFKRYERIERFQEAINDYRKDKLSWLGVGESARDTEGSGTQKIDWVSKIRNEALNNNIGAREAVRNTSQPEISVKKGDGFKAVAGMDGLKHKLKRNFVDVLRNKELAAQYNINVPSLLLFGPPGTGKTYLSMRLAEECDLECSVINPSDLGCTFVHGSQIMIKELFENAAKQAKKNGKGVILIFDEFDAICQQRSKEDTSGLSGEVAELLTQLNNCNEKQIYVIGTTNCLDRIDKAIIRKGRIDEVVYVGLPDESCRKQLFEYELMKCPHEEEIDINALVKMTDGFSPSDIAYLVEESARNSFEACLMNEDKHIVKITQQVLEEVIQSTHPSVPQSEVMRYERMRDEMVNSPWKPLPHIGFR